MPSKENAGKTIQNIIVSRNRVNVTIIKSGTKEADAKCSAH